MMELAEQSRGQCGDIKTSHHLRSRICHTCKKSFAKTFLCSTFQKWNRIMHSLMFDGKGFFSVPGTQQLHFIKPHGSDKLQVSDTTDASL